MKINFLNKTVLTAAVILAVAVSAVAQSYSVVPHDSIVLTGMLEDLQTLSIQQQNISTDTLHLKWKKISESVPALWDASVCDNSFCNTSLVDSGMMNPVIPTDYGLLLIHITPHVNFGTAIIRYAVWDISTPNLKDTLTYILSVNTTGISETEIQNQFSIYPNPAKDFISINTTSTEKYSVEIFNSIGERIYNSPFTIYNSRISIYNLSSGIYTLSISQQQKTFSRKILIQK